MPTPGSGAISMDDMRTHINRATSSSISMSEMRDRYGGSGSISFSDLRNCEGFTVNPASFSNKYFTAEGWEGRIYGFGSVSPNESNNAVQVAANSYISAMYSGAGTDASASITLYSDNGLGGANGSYTAGFSSGSITRIVTANTARTLGSTSGDSIRYYTYDWPTSGTVHCLVKF